MWRSLVFAFPLLSACGQRLPAPACAPALGFLDLDEDGWGGGAAVGCVGDAPTAPVGGDCHDGDPAAAPGAPESCNGHDDDCDGMVDEPDAVDAVTAWVDADGDGDGDPLYPATICPSSPGWSSNAEDCDDSDAGVNPSAAEHCDARDEDCDGVSDDDAVDAPTWYADADADGFGDPTQAVPRCAPEAGWVEDGTDCADDDPGIYPGAPTTCGADHDCDTLLDDADPDVIDPPTWYADVDEDGAGNPAVTRQACAAPARFVATGLDCDDTDATVLPDADERCNGSDDDCDGVTDEDPIDPGTWYADDDGDGHGDPLRVTEACTRPAGWVTTNTDCDDNDPDVNPDAAERCALGDEDCDALEGDDDPDVIDPRQWYTDADLDGYGDAASPVRACRWSGAANDEDCDDTRADTHPLAAEICEDGVDQDCHAGDQSCSVEGEWGLAGAHLVITGSGELGTNVASAGDVDGDGRADLIIGAPDHDRAGPLAGAAFVVSGARAGDVDADTDPAVVTLLAPSEGDVAGSAVTGVGDLDGDGLGEVLVGGYFADPAYAGAVWLVRGATLAGGGTISLADADATFVGEDAYDYAGSDAAGIGDTDGDGVGDILVAASGSSAAGYHAGAVYLLPGSDHRGSQSLSVATASFLGGGTGAHSGSGIDGVGDWDGDGLEDIAIGAEADATGGVLAGAAYVLLSPVTGVVSLLDADLELLGEQRAETAGSDVAGPGDTDGDGHPDLLVGAKESSVYGVPIGGAAYVVRGPLVGTYRLSSADAVIRGTADGERVGENVAGPGDMDGDGFSEVVVGAPQDSTVGHHFGGAWVFYGPISGTLLVDDADAHLHGTGSAATGLQAAGDTDGDGRMDLILGGPQAGGTAWLVRGSER